MSNTSEGKGSERQAKREDGQLLILPSDYAEEVGALSDPTSDSSSAGKGSENVSDEQGNEDKTNLKVDSNRNDGEQEYDTLKNTEAVRSVPKSKEESVGIIKSLVNQSKSIKDKVVRYVIGALSTRQKRDIASQGLDLDDNYVHSVENSAIQYNQKEHGNPQIEEKRGQIAIADRDYELIPDILDGYDDVKKSYHKDSHGRDVLVYTKAYPDGTVYYLEEVREGRKSLAFKTMYKKKNGTGGSDGLMPDASPSTPLAPSDISNSVGKGSTNSGTEQENEEKTNLKVDSNRNDEGDSQSDIQPVGRSLLGSLFDQFRGKASAAISFLLHRGEGNAIAALHHKDVGDIDLWYGNDKAGLKKIATKHPEVLDGL